VPDVINVSGGDDGKPQISEIKNYSPFISRSTACPAVATLNGDAFAMGNTVERLEHRVMGCRMRSVPSDEAFDHSTGSGYVPAHEGDYRDAIKNGKARVHLLVHEATIGGMSPAAASRLRRLARDAAAGGMDGSDYTRSFTAQSFVPFFAQRLSAACVMWGAEGILKGIRQQMHTHLRRSLAC